MRLQDRWEKADLAKMMTNWPWRSDSAGRSTVTALVNGAQPSPPRHFLEMEIKKNSWSIYPGESYLRFWLSLLRSRQAGSMTAHRRSSLQTFWVRITSDKSSHLFKQDREPSSVMCKHRDILVLAFHTLTVQKGKDIRRKKKVFSNVSDLIWQAWT